MYLLYLDASGTPGIEQCDHKHFALLGVAIHETDWFGIERRVTDLKNRYAYPGIPLELHCLAICSSVREQEKIAGFDDMDWAKRRSEVLSLRERERTSKSGGARANAQKRFSGTDSVVHLSRAERSKLYEEALDLVGQSTEIRLFAEVIDKEHLLKNTGKKNAVGPAFEQVLSRFDAFLQHVARGHGPVNHGMAVVDNDPHSDLMRDLTIMFRQSGHQWGHVEHVIETPFFVDSHLVSGIQLADVCGYALRRYVAKESRVGSHEEKQFLRIFHKFDKATNKLHGLRHYCRAKTCDCMICSTRGHG